MDARHRGAATRNNKGKDKDLLYYFELGELQRLTDALPRKPEAWMSANEQVQAWEDAARADPARAGRRSR